MSLEGFLYLHRKLAEWEWYDDANTMRLFIHCLIFANYKEKQWRGVTIKRGSFITSQPKLAQGLKLTVRQIRTSLDKLKMTGELTVCTTADYSIITINNYDIYQPSDRLNDKQTTDKCQSNDRLMTTTNKDNKDNNIREREREILEKYLLNRKKAKPIENIDAYIDNIKPDSLKRLVEKAYKWQEKQNQNVIPITQNDYVENSPEEEAKIREIQKRFREEMKRKR